jgi:hypothetical protein
VHTVRRVTADVNVQRNRDRKVHESWLELLDEVRTVAGGEAFRRNGNPDSRYSRRINSLEKRAKIAENNQHQAEVSLLDSAAAAKSFSSRCCVVWGHFYRRRRELEGACRDLESHGESSSTMSTQPRWGGGGVREEETEQNTSEFASGIAPSAPSPGDLERSTVTLIRSWIYGFEMGLLNK